MSNWDEVLVFSQERHKEGDQGWSQPWGESQPTLTQGSTPRKESDGKGDVAQASLSDMLGCSKQCKGMVCKAK